MKMSNPLQGLCAEGFATPADDVQLLERQAAERRWLSMAVRLAALVHPRPSQGCDDGCSAVCGRCTAR